MADPAVGAPGAAGDDAATGDDAVGRDPAAAWGRDPARDDALAWGRDPARDPAVARGPAHATVLVSPLASRLRDERTRRRVVDGAVAALRTRGHETVSVVEAGDPAGIRDASSLAVRSGSSLVVVLGGDGTVRDAAAALVGTGVPLGIVPGGTGNLYATAIGVPRGLDEAVAALASGTPRRSDVGEVRLVPPPGAVGAAGAVAPLVMPFVVACGTGLDARLIAATSRESKQRYGVAAYFLAASRLLEHLRPVPTVVSVDGVSTELESVVVLVANCGEAIPGRLRPRLPIDADDGLLHVFVLPRGGILGGIRGVLELMQAEATGTSSSGAGIRLAGTRVLVEVTPAGPTQVDGDPFPAASIEARVHAGGLAVLRA